MQVQRFSLAHDKGHGTIPIRNGTLTTCLRLTFWLRVLVDDDGDPSEVERRGDQRDESAVLGHCRRISSSHKFTRSGVSMTYLSGVARPLSCGYRFGTGGRRTLTCRSCGWGPSHWMAEHREIDS
jgi:hypothetical protein